MQSCLQMEGRWGSAKTIGLPATMLICMEAFQKHDNGIDAPLDLTVWEYELKGEGEGEQVRAEVYNLTVKAVVTAAHSFADPAYLESQ